MDRLTIKSGNLYALKLDNPQSDEDARVQLMKYFKLAVNKLAEFENFMEDNNIACLEDLNKIILRVKNG